MRIGESLRSPLVVLPAAALGLLACGQAEAGEWRDVETCGKVIDRLNTQEDEIDVGRLIWNDQLASIPKDHYYIATDAHEETIEIDSAQEYLQWQIGDEYCTTESVWFAETTEQVDTQTAR